MPSSVLRAVRALGAPLSSLFSATLAADGHSGVWNGQNQVKNRNSAMI